MPDVGGSIPLTDLSFVDDMALPIVCPASILISHIADVCGIVYVTFRMYGMELNFAPGKSAVVLRFQGPGKRKPLATFLNPITLYESTNFLMILAKCQ